MTDDLAALRASMREFLAADRAQHGWKPAVDACLSKWDENFSARLGDAGFVGLTIPVVAFASLLMHQQLALGLSPQDLVLFVMTAILASITLTSGEATVLQGAIHVVVFLAFAFLVFGA